MNDPINLFGLLLLFLLTFFFIFLLRLFLGQRQEDPHITMIIPENGKPYIKEIDVR